MNNPNDTKMYFRYSQNPYSKEEKKEKKKKKKKPKKKEKTKEKTKEKKRKRKAQRDETFFCPNESMCATSPWVPASGRVMAV